MRFISMLLCLICFAPAATDPTPGASLVAHYTFDFCDGRDVLEGPDARLLGRPGCRCGVSNDALSFDGTQDQLIFPGRINDYFTTSDFTLSFYLKPDGYQLLPQALFVKDATCDKHNQLALRLTSGTSTLSAHLHETPHKYYANLDFLLPGPGWIQYALVREGSMARTYLNGELQRETKRCSGIDLSNEALLSFGAPVCRSAERGAHYRGLLDEVRLYDRALTHAEVRAEYARRPVEMAELDCVTEAAPPTPARGAETDYLCAVIHL